MNKVFLIGNLTRDPELTETSSGIKICRFSLAVNRNYTGPDGERKTDYFNCTTWRGQAEAVARYAHKGNKLSVVGAIEIRDYEDSNGEKKRDVNIQVQEVEFLTPKARDEETEPEPAQKPKKPALQSFDDDDDIPF